MVKTKLLATLIAVCVVIGLAGVAAPANAATATAPITATTSGTAKSAAATPAASSPNLALQNPEAVHPDYAAGAYYYVCVGADGSQVTVLLGQTTVQVCRGAAAIQQYLESGTFVRTISLTTSGAVSDPSAINVDCALGIVGAVIVVLSAEATVLWVLSAAVGGVSAYRACTDG